MDISWYDSGSVTADGTPMALDGEWIATRTFDIGEMIEIRVGDVVLVLPVKDRTAKQYGHRADLPRETWLRFGAPLSQGILHGQWRRRQEEK